ncbi:cysteine synthase family protein [Bacteriovoracaceae bacterium]|nr:cysteine synthase family protein [Bacteriovoracaceae bacterium]
MEKFNNNILSAIGNTPIVRINKMASQVTSPIYAKLEYMNPGGSVKDRMGVYICQKAVEEKKINPGGTFIEGTSGNTGVGIAMYCLTHDYNALFVLADKQSRDKINNLKAFGANVVICPTDVEPEDERSYYSVSARLAKEVPNSFYLNQYSNLNNQLCHYEQTGPEIWQQTEGDFDTFIATVGTGGTISGIAKYLKEKKPNIKIVGVDAKGSILAHYHKTGEIIPAHSYVIEGFGEDFIPENVDFSLIDDFIILEDEECIVATRELLQYEGIYSGGSSGGAILGAIKYAQKLSTPERILTLLPDSGNRYASKIYNDDWIKEKNYSLPKKESNLDEILNSICKDGVFYE